MCPLGEDVENELGPVDNLQVGKIRDGATLRGGKLMIENEQICTDLEGPDDDVGKFPLPDDEFRIDLPAVLHNRVKYLNAAGSGEFFQFAQ